MHPTRRADAPSAKPASPPRGVSATIRVERSRERVAERQRQRLVAAWLRSLSAR